MIGLRSIRNVRTDSVAKQYERWAYPKRVTDLAAEDQTGIRDAGDPSLMHYAYWPTREYWEGMDILVAGCGTNEAARYAYHNPTARVVGIDVSASSLRHEEFLKERYGLANLSLYHIAIEEVSELKLNFDLVAANGVIHHLADPAAGLTALKQVLRLEGVLQSMLYGTYKRVGVYMLQKLFRLMGLEQTQEDLMIVKATLKELSQHHSANTYLRSAPDLDCDSGLVDTFLHKRDRSFTVMDCFNLLSECGLKFQGWIENGFYYPELQVSLDSPLFTKIDEMSEPEIWCAMELFCGDISKHLFFACREDRPKTSYSINFNSNDFLKFIPAKRVTNVTPSNALLGRPLTIQRDPMPPVALDNIQAAFFENVNGENTVKECIDELGLKKKPVEMENYARNLVRSLWRAGYLFIKLPETTESQVRLSSGSMRS